MKFIFASEELEIKGIFDSISFENGEKHVIISGKNGSGKTQLISTILEKLKKNNKKKQLNEKKFFGHLIYNLSFNFNENRMGNVKEIEDNGKILEFFEGIPKQPEINDIAAYNDYFKDKLLEKIGTQPFKFFKPFNYFIYFNKVFNYLKERIITDKKSPIDELNEDIKKYGILENSITFEEVDGKLKIKLDRHPTSGEVLFLNLLVLKWIHCNVKKFDFLLFDEPDRHFEPKITEKFLEFLKFQFKEVFIFMTTHRPDSIVLSQSYFTLCRLKKEDSGIDSMIYYLEKIAGEAKEPCNWFFVMSTIFDLTYNLRDIMNIKIRVYVESNDDYKFFKNLYHLLLDYCNELRSLPNDKKIYTEKKQQFFREFPILSRRYQLYFCTSALDIKGGSGGCSMAEKNYKRDLVQQDLDIKNFKNLWDGDFFNSYALVDRDGDLFSNNSHKYGKNFHVLKRYTIENYIADPMFLFSMINNNNSEIEFIEKFKKEFNFTNKEISFSDENIEKYFRTLIYKLLESKDVKNVRNVRNYIKKQKLVIEKMIIILNNESMNKLEEKKIFLNNYIDNHTIDEDIIEYLMKDTRKENYFKFNYSDDGKLVDPYFYSREVIYPSILLDLNGKDLVKIVNSIIKYGKDIKDLINYVTNNKKRLWISKDLVEIFSDINIRIRGYPIYYLVEKEIKKTEEMKKTKEITKEKALEIIRKAGFSEKKIDYNLKTYEDLKEWSVKDDNIILNSSK